jgi:hypothetical protein
MRSQAGEAIQFTPGKSKVATDLETSLSKERASGTLRRPGLGGAESVESALAASQRQGPQRTKREEKKAKNADIEKKNWIILDHGELQQKDEESSELGLRSDSIEKERTVGEIWFTQSRDGAKSAASSSRINSTRSMGGVRPPSGSPRTAPEDRPSEEPPGPAAAAQSQQVTASLKDPVADQKDGALKDLFRSTAPPSDGRNDELGSRPAAGSAQSGTSRGFGLGHDLSGPSQPAAGSSPLLDTTRRGPLFGPPVGDGLGLSSGARGLGAGSSFGSTFQTPFPSSGGSHYNQRDYNQKLEIAPGSSRNTFDRH